MDPADIIASLQRQVPYLPSLHVLEDSTAGRAFYTSDLMIHIPPAYQPGDDMFRYVITHEVGHAALDALGRRGDAIAALRALAKFEHGDIATADDLQNRHEIWAEHWSRAFVASYDGWAYPQLVGRLPFRSPEDTQWFFINAEAQMRSEMVGATVPDPTVSERIAFFWRKIDALAPESPLTIALFREWAENFERQYGEKLHGP